MDVRTNAEARRIESTDDGVRVSVEQGGEAETLEAEELYAFTGRKPALDGLGLENTMLEPGDDWVEDTMQADSDERVFIVEAPTAGSLFSTSRNIRRPPPPGTFWPTGTTTRFRPTSPSTTTSCFPDSAGSRSSAWVTPSSRPKPPTWSTSLSTPKLPGTACSR
ncbi:MAG: hypothetical protein ACI8VE_001980, partial [Natrialbaceae archaeon]